MAVFNSILGIVVVVFHVICTGGVSGSLVCYNCLSKKSLADCEDNQAAVLGCQGSPKNESRCYIFESISETGEVSVGKNCIGQHMCRNGNGCHRQAKQCTVKCCGTDGCNRYKNAGNHLHYHNNSSSIIKLVTMFTISFLLTYLLKV